MTFSIVACDLKEAKWGVGVQSKFLAVGSIVPWARVTFGSWTKWGGVAVREIDMSKPVKDCHLEQKTVTIAYPPAHEVGLRPVGGSVKVALRTDRCSFGA